MRLPFSITLLAVCHGKHLHVEFPYSLPFPLPRAETLAFFATPTSWTKLSALPFRIGKLVTPGANATAVSSCGQDIHKPTSCGWYVSYKGQVVLNFTQYAYNPHGLNVTVHVPFNGHGVTEQNFFWCKEMPDGNCELHRTIVADLDGDVDTLEQYKSGLYFQESKEMLEWVAIVGGWTQQPPQQPQKPQYGTHQYSRQVQYNQSQQSADSSSAPPLPWSAGKHATLRIAAVPPLKMDDTLLATTRKRNSLEVHACPDVGQDDLGTRFSYSWSCWLHSLGGRGRTRSSWTCRGV
jgi:hypothetical protein